MSEEIDLDAIAQKPFGKRMAAYFRYSGPGYMQSAMTLGGGSVATCAVFGSMMGYELLWVQPLAMLLGYFVLAAVAKQTCATQERPYAVFWQRLTPVMALLWGLSALIATVLWHIPQYSLTANGLISLAEGVGLDLSGNIARVVMGAAILGAATVVLVLYNQGAHGLKLYERTIKILVWSIVFAFMIVVFATGVDWGRFFLGITGISFLRDVFDADGFSPAAIPPLVAGIAAAVGINMIFLYPYSLLNKKWGPKHQELAYFDLISGMAVPFILATGFMMLAVANTIGPEPGEMGDAVRDIREIIPVIAPTFGEVLGETGGAGFARLLIGLAMTAIGFSTIITHMLACGFIGVEMTNWAPENRWRLIFAFFPAIGVVGVAVPFPIPLAITASTLALPLMPITVLGFLILMNTPSYMGEAMPKGFKRVVWNVMLSASVIIMTWAAYYALTSNWEKLQSLLNPPVQAAAISDPAENVEMDPSVDSIAFAQFYHEAMGANFELRMYGAPDTTQDDLRFIAQDVFTLIDDIETQISRWREGSYTSTIKYAAGKEPVRVTQTFLDLIALSGRVYEETNGAFDITILPLIDAWNSFEKNQHMPTDEELAEVLDRIGFDNVKVDTGNQTVFLAKEGMSLDFGGIGKGFALDAAARLVKRRGVENALIHGGASSIVAMGAPPGDAGWEINLAHPDSYDDVIGTFIAADQYISSSNGRARGVTIDGKLLGHILDPDTGMPSESIDSVTVIAESAGYADALSTSFYVMGREKSEQFCEAHPGVIALLYDDGQLHRCNWNDLGKPSS